MPRSPPTQSRSSTRSSPTSRIARTCTANRIGSAYVEEEVDRDDLLSQIRQLNLPSTNIINVLSERYCTQILLSKGSAMVDEHWVYDVQGRPKINIGSELIRAQDLTKRAGFLEGLKARKIQDLLLSAFGKPSTRSDPGNKSLPILLQCFAARSYNTTPTKPKPSSSPNRLESSHLCHDRSCFSPSHIILETKATNLARNACRNSRNVFAGGYSHTPCTHGDPVKGVPSCILPTMRAELDTERSVVGGMADLRRDKKRERERVEAEGRKLKVVKVVHAEKRKGKTEKSVGRAESAMKWEWGDLKCVVLVPLHSKQSLVERL